MVKQVRVTRRKREWATPREAVIKGDPLTYPTAARVRYEKSLDVLIDKMSSEYERELAELLKGLEVTQDANMGSRARILLNSLGRKWDSIFNRESRRITDRMMSQVDKQSKANLGKSLKQLSGGISIKVPEMPEGMRDVVSASIAENVALIKDMSRQYQMRIESSVLTSIQTGGQGRADVLKHVREIRGMSERRARLIARDQTAKVTAAYNAERAKSVGMKKFEWRHSGGGVDQRPIHLALNGQIFEYDDPPVIDDDGTRGLPGQLINCHPGSSQVEIAHGCVKLYRRGYTGELLTLITDDGVILQATPNHPILTDKGWKAAQEIDLGDYLVKSSCQRLDIGKTYIEHPVTQFDDFFDAASRLIGCNSSLPGSAALQFHGDFSDSEIDIIDIGRFLPNEFDACVLQKIRELLFAFSDSAFDPHSVDRTADEFMVASRLSPDSRVGSLSAFLSELRGEPGRAHQVCDGLIAYIDTVSQQNATYRGAGNSEFFRQLQFAHSRSVQSYDFLTGQILAICTTGDPFGDRQTPDADSLGEIIRVDAKKFRDGGQSALPVEQFKRVSHKRISEFSGHVYNLETEKNWYSVNGIITHNCRCVAIPVIDFGDEEVAT